MDEDHLQELDDVSTSTGEEEEGNVATSMHPPPLKPAAL
jgi:hypothetical protein